jgi:hypothetical protein
MRKTYLASLLDDASRLVAHVNTVTNLDGIACGGVQVS